MIKTASPAPTALEHDVFQWFAEIWIPTALGLVTVFVSIVALVISHRATKIAILVEDQRVAGENARDLRAREDRLQDMAVAEARALTRWVNAAAKNYHWRLASLDKVSESVHGPTLEAEARVLLEQSLVPGANELLELVALEVEHLYHYVPDAMYMPDRVLEGISGAYADSKLLSGVSPRRRERVLSLIRRWSSDPSGSLREVRSALQQAESNPDEYWDYRRGLSTDGLPPLADLPRPPENFRVRRDFFVKRGLLPPSAEVKP